jgi:hypothetical protein
MVSVKVTPQVRKCSKGKMNRWMIVDNRFKGLLIISQLFQRKNLPR